LVDFCALCLIWTHPRVVSNTDRQSIDIGADTLRQAARIAQEVRFIVLFQSPVATSGTDATPSCHNALAKEVA